MENYSYSSYPDSGDSSPRSREIDDTQSWDEPPSSNYKVKFMCSYGGKIQPRPHDNQLAYIGGETKILSLDRTAKYSAVMSKLSSLCESNLCFKYQLPGEDLDALISVTNDEDLEHMMAEFDRLCRSGASAKPARLRLFIFNLSPRRSFGSGGGEAKSEGQWFVDALNSVPVGGAVPPPPSAVVSEGNPDFLFGLEKGFPSGVPIAKLAESAPVVGGGIASKDFSAGSDCGSEDRHVMGDPVMNQQQQQHIQDFHRFQISNHEHIAVSNSRGFPGEFYVQKVPEKMTPAGPSPVPVHVQMPMPGTYVQERHVTSGPYPVSAPAGNEHQFYLIPTSNGMYQAQGLRPITGQMGHPGYYGAQRVLQEAYREQPAAYNAMPQQQPTKVGVYSEGMGVVQQKVGLPEQQGYVQMGYDSAGRQVYFTSAYQPVSAATPMDARQGVAAGGGAVNQDVKVAAAATTTPTSKVAQVQASSV
ncbi:unnamed protein product [Linum tenue]|uniref:PB1 domain-containing protein n=1 Tax=Linum tenue TaxID=586396 RepID=A0AAV0P001_9ROSI|nr:unnamed protein product [Linum tenue]